MKDVFITLYSALTYNGNWWFVGLNYFMLFLSIIPFVFTSLKNQDKKVWITFFIAVVVQAIFWFGLKVTGISIVWNAMLGVLIFDIFHFYKKLVRVEKLIAGLSVIALLAADIYFLLTTAIITTVAHCSAILLGLITIFLLQRKQKKQL